MMMLNPKSIDRQLADAMPLFVDMTVPAWEREALAYPLKVTPLFFTVFALFAAAAQNDVLFVSTVLMAVLSFVWIAVAMSSSRARLHAFMRVEGLTEAILHVLSDATRALDAQEIYDLATVSKTESEPSSRFMEKLISLVTLDYISPVGLKYAIKFAGLDYLDRREIYKRKMREIGMEDFV